MKQNKSLIDLIPNKIQVGGQDIDVSFVDSIEDGYLSDDEALVVAFSGSATEIIRSILNQKLWD